MEKKKKKSLVESSLLSHFYLQAYPYNSVGKYPGRKSEELIKKDLIEQQKQEALEEDFPNGAVLMHWWNREAFPYAAAGGNYQNIKDKKRKARKKKRNDVDRLLDGESIEDIIDDMLS